MGDLRLGRPLGPGKNETRCCRCRRVLPPLFAGTELEGVSLVELLGKNVKHICADCAPPPPHGGCVAGPEVAP